MGPPLLRPGRLSKLAADSPAVAGDGREAEK
jgi:hypothetical protein